MPHKYVMDGRRAVEVVNPGDRNWTRHRYVLWVDAHAPLYLLVWASDEGAALDEAVDYLEERAPGMFVDDDVDEDYREALAEGLDEDAARDRAEADVVRAGNCGRCLRSEDVGIALTDPTRAALLSFAAGGPY